MLGLNVEDAFAELTEGVFADLTVGMVHGRVKPKERDEILRQFRHRITQPLRRTQRGTNTWETISWQEALNEIAAKMAGNIDAGRPQANAIYHSHGNIVQRINFKTLTPRFANMLNMTLWDGNFPCWYDVGLAQELTGYYGRHDPVEMGNHSAAVINWATDPCASMAIA